MNALLERLSSSLVRPAYLSAFLLVDPGLHQHRISESPYVPGLPLSGSWATAVVAVSRLVTLFSGRTVSRE